MDISDFERLWSRKETNKEASQTFWDSRAEEFNSHQPDERLNRMVGLLVEKKMLQKNSTVLDIGCGPGKHDLEFAKRAKNVVGLDISPKMLQHARENAAKEGISNTEFMELNWEEADLTKLGWNKKFDLVTALMCPAINRRENLDKMLEASSGFCFLSHFVERCDSINDELVKLILGRVPTDKYYMKTIYCSFNILWHYKLYPEITYVDTAWENTKSLESAFRYYCSSLEMKEALTELQKAVVWDFLRKKIKNGVVKETVTAKIAWMYWKNA
jgi:SAM-dependent methyltransferase